MVSFAMMGMDEFLKWSPRQLDVLLDFFLYISWFEAGICGELTSNFYRSTSTAQHDPRSKKRCESYSVVTYSLQFASDGPKVEDN